MAQPQTFREALSFEPSAVVLNVARQHTGDGVLRLYGEDSPDGRSLRKVLGFHSGGMLGECAMADVIGTLKGETDALEASTRLDESPGVVAFVISLLMLLKDTHLQRRPAMEYVRTEKG